MLSGPSDNRHLRYPIQLPKAENKYAGKHDAQADRLIPTATTGSMETLVTPQWQLILHQRSGSQLYTWTHDPGETKDLANTPEGRSIIKNLMPEVETKTVPR